MQLTLDPAELEKIAAANISVPDSETLKVLHSDTPTRWVHVGPGNLFRGYLARLAEELSDKENWGITAVVPLDPAELEYQLKPFDLLSLSITLNPDGNKDMRVVAGITDAVATRIAEDYKRLQEKLVKPEATLLSFTITEKGYVITDGEGNLSEGVVKDLNDYTLEKAPANTMLLVTALLHLRFLESAAPITLLSCDNFSHNGDKLRESILRLAHELVARGKAEQDFLDYLNDSSKVAFPISVIDKITPRPNESISKELASLGFTDMGITTVGNVPLAGFVNTEPCEYLVIENHFAGNQPEWEKVGVHVVDRDTCDAFEQMKVTTCLNPLHTALAVSSCLLQIPTIDAAMRDKELSAFVHHLAWEEGLPVVVDPGIVKPADFLREVEEVRFPNAYLPDQPSRIAMDTSQKLAIRFGETIKASKKAGRNMSELWGIALVFALWIRYTMGVADDGSEMALSSDPLLSEVQKIVSKFEFGHEYTDEEIQQGLSPLLARSDIFGVDLHEYGFSARVEEFYKQLVRNKGAVRQILIDLFSSELSA